ncbi:hypothetical protein C5935_04415 [Cronobacter sakazakii]|nr:hypothetical protein PGS1_21711 [Enterobacter cloacae subsp. cloacae GS1]KZP80739.1 hypothetical protein A3N41_01260 [Enterobacter hormaechei subsp. steigerwaltii]PPY11909.1 hypothetical protein C3D82_06370 [Cronobacter sakazakii]PQZ00187.1 hypothetical protein C5935_04415 [Cronobacter sakazakii]PQZ02995.1 hypothetical protein C5953_04360 [Cronobacter sakazakii]
MFSRQRSVALVAITIVRLITQKAAIQSDVKTVDHFTIGKIVRIKAFNVFEEGKFFNKGMRCYSFIIFILIVLFMFCLNLGEGFCHCSMLLCMLSKLRMLFIWVFSASHSWGDVNAVS